MNKTIRYILILAGIEIVSTGFFWRLAKLNKGEGKNEIGLISLVKGMVERAFITFSLVIHLPRSLTRFAAVKITTRIKDEDKVSNDFHLPGNLLSVTLGIAYSRLFFNLLDP